MKSIRCGSTCKTGIVFQAVLLFLASHAECQEPDSTTNEFLNKLKHNQTLVANEQFMNDLVAVSTDNRLATRLGLDLDTRRKLLKIANDFTRETSSSQIRRNVFRARSLYNQGKRQEGQALLQEYQADIHQVCGTYVTLAKKTLPGKLYQEIRKLSPPPTVNCGQRIADEFEGLWIAAKKLGLTDFQKNELRAKIDDARKALIEAVAKIELESQSAVASSETVAAKKSEIKRRLLNEVVQSTPESTRPKFRLIVETLLNTMNQSGR